MGYWGGTIKTRLNGIFFSDVYCHGNGWTNLSRKLVNNYAAWSSMAREKCHYLAKKVPSYEYLSAAYMGLTSLFAGDTGGMPPDAWVARAVEAGIWPVPTQYTVEEHAAWKCG